MVSSMGCANRSEGISGSRICRFLASWRRRQRHAVRPISLEPKWPILSIYDGCGRSALAGRVASSVVHCRPVRDLLDMRKIVLGFLGETGRLEALVCSNRRESGRAREDSHYLRQRLFCIKSESRQAACRPAIEGDANIAQNLSGSARITPGVRLAARFGNRGWRAFERGVASVVG